MSPERSPGDVDEKPLSRPRVKICGVTTSGEALLAVRLGADYLGLNFHPPSPRYLAPREAARIAAAVRDASRREVTLVGVFVNRPVPEVEAVLRQVGLDLVQLHGDEPPAEVAAFGGRAIKAFRVQERFEADLVRGYESAWGYLVDYRDPRLYGGSGHSWDFSTLAGTRLGKPTFIAGGLGPHNVRAAIAAAQPWGIDVCSGVESEPGRKDSELLQRLFKEIEDGQGPFAS